jgi:hypothetical protein
MQIFVRLTCSTGKTISLSVKKETRVSDVLMMASEHIRENREPVLGQFVGAEIPVCLVMGQHGTRMVCVRSGDVVPSEVCMSGLYVDGAPFKELTLIAV